MSHYSRLQEIVKDCYLFRKQLKRNQPIHNVFIIGQRATKIPRVLSAILKE
jgi:hypothetical protein